MKSFLFYTRVFVACVFTGQWRRIWREVHIRIYRQVMSWRFEGVARQRSKGAAPRLNWAHARMAMDSADHLHPKGAKTRLSNRGFLLAIEEMFNGRPRRYLDLGCAGGGLVLDAQRLGWMAAGVDGAGAAMRQWAIESPLYAADITQPFSFDTQFNLITAWEVLEHIPAEKLPGVFDNVVRHLWRHGLFIASTNDETEIHEGVELHVTRWSNAQWKAWVAAHYPELEEWELPLETHEYARQNFKNPSFLVYRRRAE